MNAFAYNGGVLHAEAVPLATIADAVGTPLFCYSTASLTERYQAFAAALAGLDYQICYAMKANSNPAVVATLARLGAGADIVSEGELRQALIAGVPPDRIVFSGVGKTEAELRFALETGIAQINIESEPELLLVAEVARALGREAPVTFRVNPDVDPETHKKIATGHGETKFGVPWTRARQIYAEAAKLPFIRIVGVDMHIGSQLTRLPPFEAAFSRMAELVRQLRADGHRIERVDLGGGLGIDYNGEPGPDPAAYGAIVKRIIAPLNCRIVVEPGRHLVGNAGLLLTRVLFVKQQERKTFLIVDAAMNDLIRPTLYDAHHRILPVREAEANAPLAPVDVVGPVCETGDVLALDRPMPPVQAGDLLAIMAAGAYGAVMASTYNTRPLAPEVLVNNNHFACVRRRPTFDEMFQLNAMPDWLREPAPRRQHSG